MENLHDTSYYIDQYSKTLKNSNFNKLEDDVTVYCGHEYTKTNLEFLKSIGIYFGS